MIEQKYIDPILAIQVFDYPKSHDELFEVISADAILVRADYLELDTKITNLSLANGIKIYSLKSISQGGKFKGSQENRHALLLNALHDYDVIELETETDLTDDLLQLIPPSRRLISWQGKVDTFEEVETIYNSLISIKAAYHQIITIPSNILECVFPLRLLKKYHNNNQNLIAYSAGALGVWSQILSAFIGSSIIYGNLNSIHESYSFLTYEQLKEDYGLPNQRKIDTIFGIAGNPVFTSLSPLIHNKCYEYLDMNALYLPFHIESFENFWKFISIDFVQSELDISLGGFTMVSPFKEESFKAAKDHLCNSTLMSKACNILVNKNGHWYSDSSDGLGVLTALNNEFTELSGLKIAIIGCGGAGRTIAARIKSKGAEIVFYNRSTKRGRFAAKLLDLPFRAISQLNPSEFDVVINATPVGKSGKKLIFNPSGLRNNSVTIDMAYAKEDTLLVTGCRKHNKKIVEGKQILLYQVKKQFNGLTGFQMPLEVELMVREKTENQLRID